MARYINLDEAIKYLSGECIAKYPLSYSNGISAAVKEIGKLPTADVVPKSEVERLETELKAMRGAANSYKIHYEQAMKVHEEVHRLASEIKADLPRARAEIANNVAREIFEEIEKEIDLNLSVISKILNAKGGRANGKTVLISKYDVFIEAKKHLAKLKKKYTEEQI